MAPPSTTLHPGDLGHGILPSFSARLSFARARLAERDDLELCDDETGEPRAQASGSSAISTARTLDLKPG
jgi:hypothetical protein